MMSSESEKYPRPGKKPAYHVLENGYLLPNGFKPEEFKKSLTYVPDAGDIFICTYPKCGTTWMQCLLFLMKNDGKPLKEGQKIRQFIPHLEDDGIDIVRALTKPRVIKTHLPYSMLPKSESAKYIFIARNPKDCCVSFYFHTKGFAHHYDFTDGTFEDYFDLFLAGRVDFGDYFDHLLSYLPHKNDPNMLFLLYEELKTDLKQCIQKIGKFLGGSFQQCIEDPILLEKVIQNSGFKVMKAVPSLWSSAQTKDSPGFIRKGEIGDWRKYFNQEQSQLMEEKFKAKLSGTEAEHFWDSYDI